MTEHIDTATGEIVSAPGLTVTLTPNEQADYLQCKFELRNGLERAMSALEKIRDRRLYREEYATFEDFCQAEFSKTARRMDQLINAGQINAQLGTNGSQTFNERVVRELNVLPTPEQKQVAASVAQATAPDGIVTAAWMKSTVIVLQQMGVTSTVDLGDGASTPLGAAITAEHHERMLRQREHIKANGQAPLVKTECRAALLVDLPGFEALRDVAPASVVRCVVYLVTP